MALFNTQLLIQAAHLPATFKGTPDELFIAMVERMKIVSPTGISFFVTGDTMPASNQGPWLKNGKQWWVWDEELKTYIPVDVSESETKWFQVGATVPTTTTPPIWLRTTANPTEAAPNFGQPVAWYMFNGTTWVDFTSIGNRSITQSKLYWLANFYAVTTGVNDYAVTFAPTVDALPFGYGDGINGSFFCIVKFANTNTGPITLNVNNLSPRPVKKNVNQALGAGEIVAGSVHLLAYDGENFQLQTSPAVITGPIPTVPGDIVADSSGLVIKNNSGAPKTTVDITAQRVKLTTTNGAEFTTYNVSKSVNITIPGLGGLDTIATPEAPSTWYYIWLVSNRTNVSAVFSTSNISPQLPADYIYTALLGAIYNDSASDLIKIWQAGRRTHTVTIPVTPTLLVPGFESIAIAVPPIARRVFGSGVNRTIFVGAFDFTISGNADFIGLVHNRADATVVGSDTYFEVPLIQSQSVYTTMGSQNFALNFIGFEI